MEWLLRFRSQRILVCVAGLFVIGYGVLADDCLDGAVRCSSFNGGSSSTKSSFNEVCIANDQVCDGFADCPEGEDEANCKPKDPMVQASKSRIFPSSRTQSQMSTSSACRVTDFVCHSGRCISKVFVCDGNDDCGDQTDETGCETDALDSGSSLTRKKQTCSKSQFSCGPPGMCILKSWVCDGNVDCPGGADEKNCSCDGFKCRNHKCIPEKWRCDGQNDCTDGSDEDNCGHVEGLKKVSADGCLFWCKDGKKCLPAKKVCDRVEHCADGSDENGECNPAHCVDSPCEHHCLPTPDGPKCYCREGYQLEANSKNCTDTNECNTLGWCSHICANTPGGFKCSCHLGYNLDPKDNRSCLATGFDPLLLLSAGSEIRGLYLRGDQYYFLVYDSPRDIISISFDGVDSMVYWSTATRGYEGIYRGKLDGSSKPELVASGLTMPEGVAVDWVGRNVYITDSSESKFRRRAVGTAHVGGEGPPRIIVCSSDGAMCHVLVSTNIEKPRAIVLHPEEGLMFWSDWGSKPKIARAGMDGTEITDFVTTEVIWPNGLALDLPLNDLYWVDAKLDRIECIHIDGTRRRVVLDSYVRHPFSLSLFEDTVYWSDWSRKEIRGCNKFTGKNRKVLVKTKGHLPMGIHVHHPISQAAIASPCWGSQCSHLCLIGPSHSYRCVCPVGFHLSSDSRTCLVSEPQQQILISADNRIMALTPQEIGRDILENYQFPSLTRIGALDHDKKTGRVIVSDIGLDEIYSVSLKDKSMRLIASGHIDSVEGLAVDSVGRNVYWVDAGRGTLEVAKLPSGDLSRGRTNTEVSRAILIEGLDHPTDIAIVPWKGMMFVTASGDHAHIDSFSMDGKNHRHLVEVNVGHPVALCSDDDMHRIFWTDAKNGVIESVMWDGTQRIVFKQFVSQPFDLTILGTNLYWTDVHSKDLHWTSKFGFRLRGGRTAKAMMIVPAESAAPSMMKLASVSFEEETTSTVVGASHGCARNNGGCEHLCIPIGNSEKICACPTGMRLKPGNSSACVPEAVCSNSEFACYGGKCLPQSWRCDGREDCPSGEDEVHCGNVTKSRLGGLSGGNISVPGGCSSDYKWECADGTCVPRTWVCDAHPDCHDGSDEKQCPPAGCSSAEFRCKDGECISRRWRCDGDEDCDDGSDEVNCTAGNSEHCLEVGDFRCANGECIAKAWRCDKAKDCKDGSDELNCTLTCTVGAEYRCPGDNLCISTKMICDGKIDCPADGADESNCPMSSVNVTIEAPVKFDTCNSNQFKCASSGACIPSTARCDGKMDCPKGIEDELNCCGTTEFTCSGGQHCIHESWVCDGHPDCADGADETWALCSSSAIGGSPPSSSSSPLSKPESSWQSSKICALNEFQCYSGDCIPLIATCDGRPDCKDASDEGPKCNVSCTTETNPCSQSCYATPDGPACRCFQGYYLMQDGTTCDDIDECEVFRRVWSGPTEALAGNDMIECSQYCSNKKGTFKCSCADGYRLDSDRVTCRLADGRAELLVASSAQSPLAKSLQILSLGTSLTTVKSLPIRGSGINITAVDSDARAKKIYWVEAWVGSVMSFDERTGAVETLVKGLNRPNHLAYDWVTGNFFVTERPAPGTYSIAVCSKNSEKRICRTIHGNEKRYIGGLAVAPFDGYIFWSSWSPGRKELLPYGFIRRSNMDGTDVFYIAADKVSQPMGIALDSILRRIYWADSHKGTIEYANWNGAGSPVELKLSKIQVPFSVAVFEASVVWSDLGSTAVLEADKRFENSTRVLREKVIPADMRIYHPIIQPPYTHVDPCNDPTTPNCSNICVLIPSGYTCLCPDGSTKINDYDCQEKRTEHLEIPGIPVKTQEGKLDNEDLLTIGSQCDQGSPCRNGGTCVKKADGSGSYCECPKNYHGPKCSYESTEHLETWWRDRQEIASNEEQGSEPNTGHHNAGIVAAAVICSILVFFIILFGCHYYYASQYGPLPPNHPATRLIQSVQFRKPKNFRLLSNDTLQETTQQIDDDGQVQMNSTNRSPSGNNNVNPQTDRPDKPTSNEQATSVLSLNRVRALKRILTEKEPSVGKAKNFRSSLTGFANECFGKAATDAKTVWSNGNPRGFNPLSNIPDNVITKGSVKGSLSSSLDSGDVDSLNSTSSSPAMNTREIKEPQLTSSASFAGHKNASEDLMLISNL